MPSIVPMGQRRRSPLYRWHQHNGASFADIDGICIVGSYEGNRDEERQARELALCDLSLAPRTGFKGRGAPDWFQKVLRTAPAATNEAAIQPDGMLVARLSPYEFLVLGDLSVDPRPIAALERRHIDDQPAATYLLPRADSHSLFLLSGRYASAMMAKLCGVDLRGKAFRNGAVAQTSVARINAVVIRNDLGENRGYYLLGDSSCAEYLWSCLLDAMREFGGAPVGLGAMRKFVE